MSSTELSKYLANYRREEQALEELRQKGIATAKVCAEYLKSNYGVDKVILFGSMTRKITRNSDIDLAVSNLPSDKYFEALSRISLMSDFPIDLVEIETARPLLLEEIKKGWEL
ncbi:MAG: nucleotidyltransferase domain-containing protein [Pseudanabaenaceae cyanobacterium SKYGB_i_bin29]|nr:nucleotidyltransferase domain-containing protein [Pseudanabaenaceae cyanobacterium SKYG29]MDW8420808.1 nucleotidyltransferase domain-containing protein [Pseudanabaenaceae cyanobacterium SKYGB_i_bin29]